MRYYFSEFGRYELELFEDKPRLILVEESKTDKEVIEDLQKLRKKIKKDMGDLEEVFNLNI